MKKRLSITQETELLRDYPIRGTVDGWYFRITETSNGVYEVDGTDASGRRVYCRGTDPDEIMAQAERDAAAIRKATS